MPAEKPAVDEKKSGAQQVLEMVTAKPGITQDGLKILLPKVKPSTISTALHDLEKSKRITRIKADGVNKCYPAKQVQANAPGEAKPVAHSPDLQPKAPPPKQETGEESAPAQMDSFPVTKQKALTAVAISTPFRFALFTDGTAIMDTTSHGRIELTREETRELFNYMNGILDYASNDLNL